MTVPARVNAHDPQFSVSPSLAHRQLGSDNEPAQMGKIEGLSPCPLSDSLVRLCASCPTDVSWWLVSAISGNLSALEQKLVLDSIIVVGNVEQT